MSTPSPGPVRSETDSTATPIREGLRQRHGNVSSEKQTEQPATPQRPRPRNAVLGRTPEGQLFYVVETPDMVSSIFRPDTPKTPLDLITIFLLSLQLVIFFTVSRAQAQIFFVCYFAFWRAAYNGGLGYVLTLQSKQRWIVKLVQRHGWMDPARCPKVYAWVEHQLQTKLGRSYDMKAMPIDFNVWIFFRSLVDIILLNDFTAYSLFGLSHMQGVGSHGWLVFMARWLIGLLLVAFNVWVKVDAHRVVKDYAWYWGDCFFLCLQSLVFDGVYEVAPDPMYSIGYAGYYGLSLLSGSYTVLFVSIAAHISQYLFLSCFENPHIERVYGERAPIAARMSQATHSDVATGSNVPPEASLSQDASASTRPTNAHDLHHRIFRNDTVLLSHLDVFRSSDFLLVVGLVYGCLPLVLLRVNSHAALVLTVVNALVWRLFHSVGLGLALQQQSRSKWLVRHFIKHYTYADGQAAVLEAFSHWKVIYNTSLMMTYVSFTTLAAYYYVPWSAAPSPLRYVLGCALILLHVWSARSSYRVLGPFGWLYGDFFIEDYQRELSYTGIYRFLNNPERVMGSASLFGLALISGSVVVAAAATLSHVCHWWFLSYVEGPHMRRVYGASLRGDSGVTKQLKQLLPQDLVRAARPGVEELQTALTKAQALMDQLLDQSRPRVERLVDDTRALLQQQAGRILTMHIGEEVLSIDTTKYRVEPSASSLSAATSFHIGEPITVHWTAAHNHSRRDWIGLYLCDTLASHPDGHAGPLLVTRVSSQGHWIGVAEDEWQGDTHTGATSGPLGTRGVSSLDGAAQQRAGVSVLRGARLPWVPGTYELRYHHDGTHDVLARSAPFTIYVDTPADPYSVADTYAILTKLVQFAQGDAPASDKYKSADHDDLVLWTQEQVQHIADGIRRAFNVDFAKEVIVASANTQSLARAIVQARQLLQL